MKYRRICIVALLSALWFMPGCREKQSTVKAVESEPPALTNTTLLQELSGKIVFQSDRSGNVDIYVMNADGSDLVQLTHDKSDDEYPVWSPDGQQIAFKSNRNGNFDIYVMDADGSNQRQITNDPANDEDPAWSPDGTRIVFHSDRKGSMEVFVMNADGSDVTQLTDTIGKNGIPAWSPDGTRIAYTGNRYLGWNVYVMDVDGSNDRRLTDGHGACRPDWSPDSTHIAFVSKEGDGKGEIWVMPSDASTKTRLTTDEAYYDYYPAWSPDGRYIAYAKGPEAHSGNWEIYVMTADGKQHLQLTDHPALDAFPDWWLPTQ
ncbi:WD40-like Beta Propeller [Candidatus Vecturithrix granuli]|uniref:WD40-like Beta Propeller n=1 Tax=Vecturithrix granuli TaxID=1499967 RepID=A0A081C0I3_VECG1|nr:WD40-like Beta Propeller [Candidatus Vecturithrix granuli]